MKKVLFKVLALVVIITNLFILSGCNDKQDGKFVYINEDTGNQTGRKGVYDKSVKTYTVQDNNKTATVSFEFTDDRIFDVDKNNGILTITNKENQSKIIMEVLHDTVYSNRISKEERDFIGKSARDYKKINIGKYNGWSIYIGDTQYEMTLILTDPEGTSGLVYAINIVVKKSLSMRENVTFDVKEFVESDDFGHILDTLKFEKQ
jgi:uncharacterized lipoprotein YehR (DUF1307 family)